MKSGYSHPILLAAALYIAAPAAAKADARTSHRSTGANSQSDVQIGEAIDSPHTPLLRLRPIHQPGPPPKHGLAAKVAGVQWDTDVQAGSAQVARRLLRCIANGSVQMLNEARDTPQLESIAAGEQTADGLPILRSELLAALSALALRSSPDSPLIIVGLRRQSDTLRPHEPHSLGEAVDIAAFGGHNVRSGDADESEKAVLAILKALPVGDYRLGLPIPPGVSANAYSAAQSSSDWPFFVPGSAPQIQSDTLPTLHAVSVVTAPGGAELAASSAPTVWHYAAPEQLGSMRVAQMLKSAASRGANVYRLFPDNPLHIHLDIKSGA